jgi:hypothetical protein
MLSLNSYATTLTGSLVGPNGTGVTGTISFALSQQASLSAGGSCGGLKQIMPTTQVVFTVTNGSLVGTPTIYGNDCLSPVGTYYYVLVKDSNGNQLFNDRWIITGTTIDLGSIISMPTNTVGTIGVSPLLNVVTLSDTQTITGQKSFTQSLLASGTPSIGSTAAPFASGFYSGQVVAGALKVINGTVASPNDFFGITVPALHTMNLVDSSGNAVLSYYNGAGLGTATYNLEGSLLPAGAYNFGSSSQAWSNAFMGQVLSPKVAITNNAYAVNWTMQLQASNVLGWYDSSNNLRMTLDSTGTGGFGVNLTTPSLYVSPTKANTQALLVGGFSGQSVAIVDVQQTLGGSSYFKVDYDGSVYVSSGPIHLASPYAGPALTVSSSYAFAANFTDTGGTCRIGFASGGITCPSDARLKTNIAPLPSELARVMKLNPVSFDWIKSGENADGLIAQEVQEIFPKAVHEADGYLNISYPQLVPYLIKALQEQQSEINKLKKRRLFF